MYHLSLVAVWYAITRLIFHTYPIQQVIRWLVNANQNTRKSISSEWFDLNIIHTQKNKNSNYNCGWMKTFRFKLLSHTKTVCFTLNSNHTFRALFSVNKDVCVPLEREIKSRSFQQYFIFFYRYTAVCVRQRKLFRMFVLWDYTEQQRTVWIVEMAYIYIYIWAWKKPTDNTDFTLVMPEFTLYIRTHREI